MTQTLARTIKVIFFLGALAVGLAPFKAQAQVEVVVGPPQDYLATTAPVYFEGRPAYWWGGHWYFHDGAAWRYYHEEPAFLRDYRGHHPVYREFYGRGHGHEEHRRRW